jgi:hypothetical protein
MGSLRLQGHSQGRPSCRTRHGEVRDRSPQVVYVHSNTASQPERPIIYPYSPQPQPQTINVNVQPPPTGPAVVDKSVRQLKKGGDAQPKHWRTMANNGGFVMQICYAIGELALLTSEPVREGFEPSVAFWATAL